MDTDALIWTGIIMLAGSILGFAAKEIEAFKASKFAQQHAAAGRLADVADDICSAGMAFLTANPTASPHAAAAWALSELRASAPALITQAGSLASDEALGYMVNRKMVTAAQAAPISAAASAVIDALAPSAATARVSPPQLAAAGAASVLTQTTPVPTPVAPPVPVPVAAIGDPQPTPVAPPA